MLKGKRALLSAACAVGVLIFVVLLVSPSSPEFDTVPTFSIADISHPGQQVVLSDELQTPVVINFWASWCIPCRREMKTMEAASQRYHGTLRFVGLNTEDRIEDATNLIRETGATYELGFDPTGRVASEYHLIGMPTTVYVSRSRQIVARFNGEMSQSDVDRLVHDGQQASFSPSPALPLRPPRSFDRILSSDQLSLAATTASLVASFILGALHALAPGHGKTMMAAFLVGGEGRRRDALLMGVMVAGTHTVSVVVLGALLYGAGRSTSSLIEDIYVWLAAGTGVVVAGCGAWLLLKRLRTTSGRSEHGGTAHLTSHGHSHGGRHHVHGSRPLSRNGLFALASTGGLFPSPAALALLVSALAIGRPLLGLALVGLFSVGLATSLSAVGLVLVAGRGVAERRGFRTALELFPILGASWMLVLGSVVAVISVRGA